MAAFFIDKDCNGITISTHVDSVNQSPYTRTVYVKEKCVCDKKSNRAERRIREKLGCFKKFYGK